MLWQTSRRIITIDRPLVMGILNVTPDSFSDGNEFASVDAAMRRAEEMIAQGADLIDIGGESTRPGSCPVAPDVEIARVVPAIAGVAKRFDVPVSIDTSKSPVATAAIDAGAEIINDIAGLRWDPALADVAAGTSAGLILMHSRDSFASLHSEPPVGSILHEVRTGLARSIQTARDRGVAGRQLALDIGIGFGKTFEQNIELLAKLDQIIPAFADHPMLVGTSRKSFIGKLLDDAPIDQRLGGSIATAVIAVQKGAKILRVHDVKETVQALKFLAAIQ